jgi:ubiquinol-cytochrome c reductase cytochrome c1 subunit
VLAPLQGLQQPRFETTTGADGKQVQHLVGLEPGSAPGDLPAASFDSLVRDTVAFLESVSEPSKAKRQALGVWVILFLLMFTTFAWFLYKEYWKDVK